MASPAPSTIPSAAARESITASLDALVSAIKAHPEWPAPGSSAPPHPSLFHIWDFVNRSRYILSELGNIQAGLPLRHPDQIPGPAAGEQAAAQAYGDVCSRAAMVDTMVQNPQMLVMLGMSQVDFGEDVQTRSKAVSDAIAKA
jgi:hypothetical protein